MVKMWIDKKTRSKISFLNERQTTAILLEHIDMKVLPDFLGGKNKDDFRFNHGPWENELENSYIRKSYKMVNQQLYRKYFLDEEERKHHEGNFKNTNDRLKEKIPIVPLEPNPYNFSSYKISIFSLKIIKRIN